jgi:GAF domain-containing protein
MEYLEAMSTTALEQGRLAEEQAALRRVATLVASGASSTEVFDAVAQEVAQVLHLPNTAVCRYEDEGTAMTVLAAYGERPDTFGPGSRWPLDGPSMSADVLRTGRPARFEDYTDLPGSLAAEAPEHRFDRVAGAPIIVDGRVWGVISTSSPDAPLPDRLEDRLAEFTELVATAIANSQAHEELERLAEEQAALRRVATLVAQGATPAEVFQAVSVEVAQLAPAEGAALTRFESDGTVTALGGWTLGGGYLYSGARYSLEGTVSGRVFESGAPERIDNYDDEPGEAAAAAREMGWRSSIGAPITVEGRLWGVLAVVSASEKPLPPGLERRLAAFTELVATAVANAESREDLTILADEQAALRRVATLVAQGASPAEVFDAVTREVGQLIRAEAAGLARIDANGMVTSLGTWTRAGSKDVLAGARFPLESPTAASLVVETRRPARVESYEDVPGRGAALAREAGWQSTVAAPIIVDGGLWGVVGVSSTRDTSLPADTEQRLMQFTELVATAIANAASHEELALLAEEQSALRRVATLVAEGASPDHVFTAVGTEVARTLGVPVALLFRYEADGMATILSTSSDEFGAVGTRLPIASRSLTQGVYETGRAFRIDDWEKLSGPGADFARERGLRWGVGVPIVVDGALWGVMNTASREPESRAREVEPRLAKFTELLATAIANAQGREELRARSDEQAALRRIATLVARGLPPPEILASVAEEVHRVLDADWAAVHRLDADGVVTVVSSDGVMTPEIPVDAREALGPESLVATVLRTGRSARIETYEDVPGEWARIARELGVRSAVGAPITVEGRPWGVMLAAWSRPDGVPGFDVEDRMAKFTELVGTAIANAESRAELDSSRSRIVATADATRRRIERDLHDGAQQQLLSLALEIRAAQASVPQDLHEHREDLSRVAEGLMAVLDGLREIALGLHPAILAEGGLGPALKILANRSPIPVQLEVDVAGRLPEPVEVTAYYIVSEALTNAAKHAGASVVHVEVGVHGPMLRVAVRDDGGGGADPNDGSGLLGLKDRAEAIGGKMQFESRHGEGTSLTGELPLAKDPG